MTEFEKLIDATKRGSLDDVADVIQHRPELINKRDETGAVALHYAAFGGHRAVVKLLVQHGAEVNTRDTRFGATPAGWAIEYLRELGGFLGIELEDFAHAIRRSDIEWVARFLMRFPALRQAVDTDGVPFKVTAAQTGNPEIVRLFESGAAS